MGVALLNHMDLMNHKDTCTTGTNSGNFETAIFNKHICQMFVH